MGICLFSIYIFSVIIINIYSFIFIFLFLFFFFYKSPSENNLNEYLDTIKKLKEAYKYVLETPFESFEKTSVKMV